MSEVRKKWNRSRIVPMTGLIVLLMTSFLVTLGVQMNIGIMTAKGYETMEERVKNRLTPSAGESSSMPNSPTVSPNGQEEFAAQAALFGRYATPSNNIVNTQAIYELGFRTQTSGTIHKIEFEFPPGTIVEGRIHTERFGIGPGALVSSGNKLIYNVVNPVNVPAGTVIKLEIANIQNPPNAGAPLQVIITTRGALDVVIDGPTATNFYYMKNIGSAEISPTFMVSRILNDGQNGWNPDPAVLPTNFVIGDSSVKESNSHVYVSVDEPSDVQPFIVNVVCMVEGIVNGSFEVVCDAPPSEGSKLRYTVINQP